MIDVEFYTAGFVFAVFGDEIVESVLPTADGNDFRAFQDEASGDGSNDARLAPIMRTCLYWKGMFEVDCFLLEWIKKSEWKNSTSSKIDVG